MSGPWADLYTTMCRIRAFEERVGRRFREGDVHGFVHVSIGQEAVAAGACAALERGDWITTTHRGHGRCLAKGADPTGMFAELFGRASGLCHGKGGSMHIADPRLGILGANGIVGAGVPLAVGAALTSRVRRSDAVAVAFFGDGAVHSGAFHEGVTLAVGLALPIVFVCEDNGWAEFTPRGRWGRPRPPPRAAGRARRPPSAPATTGWPRRPPTATTRSPSRRSWRARSPTPAEAAGRPSWRRTPPACAVTSRATPSATAPRARCSSSPSATRCASPGSRWAPTTPPTRSSAAPRRRWTPPCRPRWPRRTPSRPPCSRTSMPKYLEALNGALADEMERDETVALLGVDVGEAGGVYGATRGLYE